MNDERGKGDRSEILLDQLDMYILDLCKTNSNLGIMEIKERLALAHNSLKPPLDRLHKFGLIKTVRVIKRRKLIIKTTPKGRKIYASFLEEDY